MSNPSERAGGGGLRGVVYFPASPQEWQATVWRNSWGGVCGRSRGWVVPVFEFVLAAGGVSDFVALALPASDSR